MDGWLGFKGILSMQAVDISFLRALTACIENKTL